jgi:hypothetical protein
MTVTRLQIEKLEIMVQASGKMHEGAIINTSFCKLQVESVKTPWEACHEPFYSVATNPRVGQHKSQIVEASWKVLSQLDEALVAYSSAEEVEAQSLESLGYMFGQLAKAHVTNVYICQV